MTIMKTLSIRVPDELEERLDEEARLAGKRKSELARVALDRFLEESRRERLLARMRAAARFLRTDPGAATEIREISDEFSDADAESLEIGEGPGADDERWWD